jgi:LysR family transcriptional regulator, benzoate and cis,cis-muconate-responsive activator of ben and cat genes
LQDGKLDLCLMVRQHDKALRGLKVELLREYPQCVAVAPGHPLAKLKRVAVAQLAAEPLVAFTRADYPEYHLMLEELFQPLGLKPRVAEEHDSAASLIAAVEIGRGAAVVASSMSILAGGRIVLRPLHPAPAPLAVVAGFRPGKLSAAARKFLEAARNAAKGSVSRLN